MGRAAAAEHIPDGCEKDSKGDWESEAEIIMEDICTRRKKASAMVSEVPELWEAAM